VERLPNGTGEDEVLGPRVSRRDLVTAQQSRELRHQHNVALARAALERLEHAALSRELVADMQLATFAVDVEPTQAEELLQAKAAEDASREQHAVRRRGGGQKPPDLLAGKDALIAPVGCRPLAMLESYTSLRSGGICSHSSASDISGRRTYG